MGLIENDYLTVKQLAERERVVPKSVFRWLASGVAPKAERFHGAWYFPIAELTGWTKPKPGRRAK